MTPPTATLRYVACAWVALFSSAIAVADVDNEQQSPREAVQAFIEAIRAGDERAVLAAYAPVADKEQAESVQLFVDVLVAAAQLHAAIKGRFGDEAKNSEVYKIGAEFDVYTKRAAKRVLKATSEVKGDTAVVKLPDRDQEWELLNPLEHDIVLRKVEGRWKIDLPKTLGVEKLTDLTSHAMAVEMRKRFPVLKKFAKAISAGKYKDFNTFDEQFQAWHDKPFEDPFKE